MMKRWSFAVAIARKGLLLIVAALASLIAAGSAQAATPILMSVGQQNGYAEATFDALYDVDSLEVSIATKPDRGSDGRFLNESILHGGYLTDDEINMESWRSERRLEPGLYYVMARSSSSVASPVTTGGRV